MTTFAEWSKKTGIQPTHPNETGMISVIVPGNHPQRGELWELEDFKAQHQHSYPNNFVIVYLTPRETERYLVCISLSNEMPRLLYYKPETVHEEIILVQELNGRHWNGYGAEGETNLSEELTALAYKLYNQKTINQTSRTPADIVCFKIS